MPAKVIMMSWRTCEEGLDMESSTSLSSVGSELAVAEGDIVEVSPLTQLRQLYPSSLEPSVL